MADIQSTAARIRRGKKEEEEHRRRKKLQGKNIMAPLLHRAAIIINGNMTGTRKDKINLTKSISQFRFNVSILPHVMVIR